MKGAARVAGVPLLRVLFEVLIGGHLSIFHYTKASTLPLILANKTIRFTRADRLDDRSEVPFRAAELDPRFYFLSSWTTSQSEQAAQWSMYGDNWRGIRIGLPESPFPWSTIQPSISRKLPDGRNIGFRCEPVRTPYSEQAVFGNGYILVPDPTVNEQNFGAPVRYVDDPAASALRFVKEDAELLTVRGSITSLARIKGRGWSHQDEFRFALFAVAGPSLKYDDDRVGYGKAYLDTLEARFVSRERPLMGHSEATSIDLPLRDGVLDELSVTLGPGITDENRAEVMKAIEQFAPSAQVTTSKMTPNI